MMVTTLFSFSMLFQSSELSNHVFWNFIISLIHFDDAFFQPDWAGAYWDRWAGTRAVVDLSKGSGSSG